MTTVVAPERGVPAPERLTDADRLANAAWESVVRVQSRFMRAFAQEDVWGPLSMREYDVLYTLRKAPRGGLRLRDLNEDVYLSQPSLSRLVERMEQRGLVTRSPAPDDARGVLVAATAQGRRLQHEVGTRHARSVARHVGGVLTADELHELLRLCTRLGRVGAQRARQDQQDETSSIEERDEP